MSGVPAWCAAVLAGLTLSGAALAQTKHDAAILGGKPVAAFAIDYEVRGTPTVGVPLEVQVSLRPQTAVSDVTVRLSADPGLQIASPETTLSAPSAEQDAPAEWLLSVVPLEDGVLRLRLYAEGTISGMRQGRSLIIPIRVGPAAPAKRDQAPLIRLPSTESR